MNSLCNMPNVILCFISGRNPLHLAARGNYTQTVELLHSVHSHLLDQVDKDGVREG
jgi:hypothetical protein